jgi:hypothetical protein
MALIAAGQQGLLIHTVAGVIGVDEPVARAALERLLRAIAHRLSERAADPVEHEILLDVIARGGFQRYLDDPRVLFGRDAVRDGESVLVYLYGSVEAARARAHTLGSPAGLDREVFARLMTLAAVLLPAAIARRLDQLARDPAGEAGAAGMLKGLGRAMLRGLADGTVRTVLRRASFRHRIAVRRLIMSRRRPGQSPSRRSRLDVLLGDLLEEDAEG